MRPTAKATSLTSPIGGLNDRDSIADMKATDALVMDNWWPYPSYIGIRKGQQNHVTGIPNPVQTLAEYLPPSGASKLFAASGTFIYDVTTAGAVGAPVQTGLTSAYMQDASITTPGGSFLYLVNGQDSPRLWSGTTWVTVTGASTPAITGVTTSTLVHVALFKNRLFFVQKDSMSLWFLPVNSVGGAASEFSLGSVFRLGGSIMACYSWTIDAGNGSDDHFVIISTSGEVAVYRGTDPSSAANWALIGVFKLGKPLGRRCAVKFGGDLAVNTVEGIYPLGRGLLSASIDRRVALSDRIQNTVSNDATQYYNNVGWQVTLYSDANMLLINVPTGLTTNNYQYAQNTITGAWCKFLGMGALCWASTSTGLYYGTDTGVQKAWTGNLDNTTPITAELSQAFSYFGNKAQNKYFTMIRPYILSTGQPSVLYGLNLNFLIAESLGSLPVIAPTGMVWGSMAWGSMVWGGGLTSANAWAAVGGVGNTAGLRLRVQNNGAEVRLNNTDFLYNVGGVL